MPRIWPNSHTTTPSDFHKTDEDHAGGYLEASVGDWGCDRAQRVGYRHCSTQNGQAALFHKFNFSDHLGLGHKLDDSGEDEIELRVDHYSNGGIQHPNPGENWIQMRYMHWFR